MRGNNMPRWLAILLALAVAQLAFGKEVTLEMPNRLIARADYQIGAADKPVVLILHGFLQTHDFHTAHNMADGLHDLGYNVLAPTLTLGVPYRNQSLACEAIHGHSLEDDEAEIGVWLDWLEARHQGPIILLGHSTGSVELLAYLSQHRDPRIKKLIGASIIEGALTGGEQVRSEMIADLKQRIGAKNNTPVSHQFSYCNRYTSTPKGLLSYLRWSPKRIIVTAQAIATPITFIMGGTDQRLATDWIAQLRKTGKKIRVIEGAGHFLDGQYEFDLLDVLGEEVRL
ncbi:MAG: DUF1749 domain-containing protein [Hydrogenophilales bacterium CG15_BIG_FIL_POST_REV_8_21_14_020_62_31]|nr:MAG: DUF1749 domain-containing protein [Hydrogenophilales bacterium CG15_BIG_FIL_POST_REV_8_21_14_020_62_31]